MNNSNLIKSTKKLKLKFKRRQTRIFFVLLIFSILAYISDNNSVMFVASSITGIYIIMAAKFSFFSVFSFILWFNLLQEFIASINVYLAGGMLWGYRGVPVYFKELFVCIEIFYLTELLVFATSSVLKNEKLMYLQNIKMEYIVAIGICTVALLLIFLSYPSLPRFSGTLSRNEGYILSERWAPIVLFLIATTYDSALKHKSLLLLWAVGILWILFHGERVAVFGFLVYIMLKYVNTTNKFDMSLIKMLFKGNVLKVGIIGIAIVLLGVYLQYSRMGQSGGLILKNIYAQGTACDVVYVFNCSIDMWKKGNLYHGYTLLNYLTFWIPGMSGITNNVYAPAVLIQKDYFTVGGGLFFVEPVMNFGLWGVFPYSYVYIMLLCAVLSKQNKYMAIFWIPFVTTIFRTVWYVGLDAWSFMSLYLTPVVFFMTYNVNTHRRRRHRIAE